MKRARNPCDDDDDYSSSDSEYFHQKKLRYEEDTPQPSQPIQRKHYCVICEKQFSSGKAYGGHVRIHSNEYNNKGKMKKKLKKMKMKMKRKMSLVKKEKEKEIDLIRCYLCGKEFQTMNSLFGHMRRHPERSWKGIRPPPPSQVRFNLNNDDGSNDDSGDESEDEVVRAAYILLMLNLASEMNIEAMESPKSYVRSSSCSKDDGDIKIEMETHEVKVNEPQGEAKKPLGFDINKPYSENDDHPYSS